MLTVAIHDSAYGITDDGATAAKNGEATIEILANDGFFTNGKSWFWHSANEDDYGGPTKDQVLDSLQVEQPQHGTLAVSDDGVVTYTTKTDFDGIDHFEYSFTVNDSEYSADVYVNVVEPLFALRDWFRVDEDSQNNLLDVLQNDRFNSQGYSSTGDFDQTTFIASVGPSSLGGTIEITADKKHLIYTAPDGGEGVDTFRYVIEDDNGYQSEAEVRIQVTTLNGSDDDPVFEDEVLQRLLESALDHHDATLGQFVMSPQYLRYRTDWDFDTAFAITALATGSGDADLLTRAGTTSVDEASSTNNQEADVEEADLVKTDGDYLYMVSNWTDDQGDRRHQLVITDVRDPATASIVSRYALEGPVESLFLHDGRVTLLSQDATTLNVTLLDVTDPTSPTMLFESSLIGELNQARAVGEHVYVISETSSEQTRPPIEQHCYGDDDGCFYETAAQYIERVQNLIAGSLYANVETRFADGTVATLQSPLLDPPSGSDSMRSSVISFDVEGGDIGAVDIATTSHSASNVIYVSPDAIYFLSPHYGDHVSNWSLIRTPFFIDIAGGGPRTTVEKIDFDGAGELSWSATGTVDGHVKNSFGVSQHDGYLRVATEDRDGSSLHVLRQDGETLETIASLENLAPGEDLYSMRFEEERAFLVTFRKVDPLFVIDLSDPTSPELLGELKITGYSNYLQLIDENHLLGIGREANENGLFQEMQISLFDISDVTDPKLKHRYSFDGGRNLWSPLMQDAWNLGSHHSVSYFASHQTLVLPVYEGRGGNWSWNRGSLRREVEMRVLDLDLENGISELGSVEFSSAMDPEKARAVRVGDALLSIAPEEILVHKLRDPTIGLTAVTVRGGVANDSFETRGEDDAMLDVLANDRIPVDTEVTVHVDQPAAGGEVIVTEQKMLRFLPDPGFRGEAEFTYQIASAGEAMTGSVVVDVKRPWHNRDRPMDVNRDGDVNPRDLLGVINLIGRYGSGGLDSLDQAIGDIAEDVAMADVNRDGKVTPSDALTMINHFIRLQRHGEGEAVASIASDFVPAPAEPSPLGRDDDEDHGAGRLM